MNRLVQLNNINWPRVLSVVAAFTAAWAVCADVVPPHIYKYVSIAMAAITTFVTTLMRPTNYVPDRKEPPK